MVSRERVCLFFISINLFIRFYIVGYCEEVGSLFGKTIVKS